MSKTAREAKAEFILDLVSVAQVVARVRHGDAPNADQISQATHSATGLLQATEGERLAAERELFIRYGIE